MSPDPETQPIAGLFTPRLVARLHREAFDGTLRLHSSGATRVIYYRRGDIASAASNAEGDRLHNILIREGRLTGPQVEMARSKQGPGSSLGKVLIELGFLTPSELLQGARRQVRQILAACFSLSDGTWQTVPGTLGPEVTNLGLPVRRLIFDALFDAGDRQAIVREMGSMESIYRPEPSLAEALSALRLDAAMEEVAGMIDGRATLREISSRTRLDDFSVSRIVLALEILGLASMASEPEPVVAQRPGRVIPIERDEEEPAAAIAVQPADAIAPPPAEAVAAIAEPAWSARGAEVALAAAPAATRPVMATALPAAAPEPVRESPATAATALLLPVTEDEDSGTAPLADARARGPLAVATEPPAPPAAEPPPFPPEELPAFAGEPRDAAPIWRVDPGTGEKVHEGPIELTFDGPVAPGRSHRSIRRVAIGLGAGAAALVAVALVFILRGSGEDASQPSGRQMSHSHPGPPGAAGPSATGPSSTGPGATGTSNRSDHVAATGAAAPAASGSGDAESVADGGRAAGGSRPPDTAATVPATATVAAGGASRPADKEAAAPPKARGADPAPPAETTATGTAPAADGAPGVLAPGQARLDTGDVRGAAAIFQDSLAALPADRCSLQILIACEDSTIRKARAALPRAEPIFVTPFPMQGRECHRLMWGIFPDRVTAQQQGAALPSYFVDSGVKPVVVPLGRLRPRS